MDTNNKSEVSRSFDAFKS